MGCDFKIKRMASRFQLPKEYVIDESIMVVLKREQVMFIVYVVCMFFTLSSLFMVFSMWNWLALMCTWMGYTCILLYSLDSTV
jgi:hypothetical protein